MTHLTNQIKYADDGVNMYWYSIETFNVFLMQMGFTFLEAGSIREEHIDHILLKNIMDLCTGSITWFFVGFGLAYGETYHGLFGQDFFLDFFDGEALHIKWVNSWAYQSTACTIVSGAIAERMQITAYIVINSFMSLTIYPIASHWVWNDEGWLSDYHYVDFAGCGPVHILGGTTGLILTTILGPRLGKFIASDKQEEKDEKKKFKPNNIPFVMLGTLILWYTWYSFNASSQNGVQTEEDKRKVGVITTNTTLAAIFGGLLVYLIQHIKAKMYYTKLYESQDSQFVINTQGACMGILSGLVGITAVCDAVTPLMSAVIGTISAIVYLLTSKLLIKLKIDDPLNAAPLHLGCGFWGALAVGLFHSEIGLFYNHSWKQLKIQLVGVLSIIGLTFALIFPVTMLFHKLNMLRIPKHEEEKGFQYQLVQVSYKKKNRKKAVNNKGKGLKIIKELDDAPGNFDSIMKSKKGEISDPNDHLVKKSLKTSCLSDRNSHKKKFKLNATSQSWDNSVKSIPIGNSLQQQQQQPPILNQIPFDQQQILDHIIQSPYSQGEEPKNNNANILNIPDFQSISQRLDTPVQLKQQISDCSQDTKRNQIPEEDHSHKSHKIYQQSFRHFQDKNQKKDVSEYKNSIQFHSQQQPEEPRINLHQTEEETELIKHEQSIIQNQMVEDLASLKDKDKYLKKQVFQYKREPLEQSNPLFKYHFNYQYNPKKAQ